MKHITDIFFEIELNRFNNQSHPPLKTSSPRQFAEPSCAHTSDSYGLLFTDAAYLIRPETLTLRSRASFP
jgi:hypothetical protein